MNGYTSTYRMNKTILITIFVVRVILALVAAWQVLGLLPVLTWVSAPSQIAVGMWLTLTIKLVTLVVCLLTFFGLKRLASKLRAQAQAKNVPALPLLYGLPLNGKSVSAAHVKHWTSIAKKPDMLKKQLDTPWKRVAFLSLFLTVIALLAAVGLPPPLVVRHVQEWRDAMPGQEAQRTIRRVGGSCADTAMGGKPFAQDYWIIASANGQANPYRLMMVEEDVRPTHVDVTEEELALVRNRLNSGEPTCIREHCATQLSIATLQQVLSSCSTIIPQSLDSSRIVDWDQDQIKERLPLILSLFAFASVLACLSFWYRPTIGTLVSWIKNG